MLKKRSIASKPSGALKDALEALGRNASVLGSDLGKTGLNALAAAVALLVIAGAALEFAFEGRSNPAIKGVFDGIWWAVVTVATVGYGDVYPTSLPGRIVAIAFMLCGFVLTAMISGTVASIFVERRIREGKGLRELKLKGHILMCGWNASAEKMISAFEGGEAGRRVVLVLLNDREGDWFEALKSDYPGIDLKFARGHFWDEAALLRASAQNARAVVIVPDESGGEGLSNADERSILAALTCRSLNPEARVSAEILKQESEAHLRRAGVTDLVVRGEFSPFLLSSACSGSGLAAAARRVLSPGSGIRLSKIPAQLVGRSFLEASEHFMRSGQGLMLGLYSEEKGMTFEDLISDDSSAIDAFIKRKFKESSLDMGSGGQVGDRIRLNPGADCLIREGDCAFVLG